MNELRSAPLGQKSYKSIQIQQIRALDLRDFEQICGKSSTSEALRGYFDKRSEENSLTPYNNNRKHGNREALLRSEATKRKHGNREALLSSEATKRTH